MISKEQEMTEALESGAKVEEAGESGQISTTERDEQTSVGLFVREDRFIKVRDL